MKILTIIALASIIVFTWGAAFFFFVAHQVVLNKCVNDFHGTGAEIIVFKGTYCTATIWGDSEIVPLWKLEEVRETQKVVP